MKSCSFLFFPLLFSYLNGMEKEMSPLKFTKRKIYYKKKTSSTDDGFNGKNE